MPIQPQTANFPPIVPMEISWEQSVRKSMELLAPGEGIRSGLRLGLPKAGGLVTTGLTPTLTNGYLVRGDQVLGPFGSKLISAIAANQTNKNIYFGLEGMSYGNALNAPPLPTDVLIGSASSSANSILHLGQRYNYGGARFGVRGVINLAQCPKGADTTFFTWPLQTVGLENVRIVYAQARVVEAVSAGNATGDDFTLKVKKGADSAITLVSIAAASLTAGTVVRNVSADGDALSWHDASSLLFQYNQVDASANFVGGEIEVIITLEAY